MSDVYFHDPAARGMQLTGMTLRDYFAAKALGALIRKRRFDMRREDYYSQQFDGWTREERGAYMAYAYADAMLAARTEKP
jgi:ssDNA-specific exonuclease RecJ